MYYTGFTYLFTRKLTKTPDLLASLHCFSGKHLRQWNGLFAPTQGVNHPDQAQSWTFLFHISLWVKKVSLDSPQISNLVGLGPNRDGFVWPM